MGYTLSGWTGCWISGPASMAAEVIHDVAVEAHRPSPDRPPAPYLPAAKNGLVTTATVPAFQMQINSVTREVVKAVEALVAPHTSQGKG